MAFLKRAFLSGLIALVGCERTPTLIEIAQTSVVVQGVLLAGADSATVLVFRPMITDGDPANALGPVRDAQVSLVHGADTIQLRSHTRNCVRRFGGATSNEAAPADVCYSNVVPGGVRAGDTYMLIVNVAGSAPIHGITHVPAPPVIHSPASGLELLVASNVFDPQRSMPVFVHWSGAPLNTRVELRFTPEQADCDVLLSSPDEFFSGRVVLGRDGVDTATVVASAIRCATKATGRYAARLVVTVSDEGFARYVRDQGDAESIHVTEASVGLTGAFGVFAAVANASVPVTLNVIEGRQ